MKRVLVFGDTHIPTRAGSIPDDFYQHISATTYNLALITGDLVQEDKMRKALPPLPKTHIVQGNMDFGARHDFHKKLKIEDFDVLLLHGTQIRPRGNISQLWEVASAVGVDVAIHGHSHQYSLDLHKGVLFLNPGTLSGATGGTGSRKDASFIELEISEASLRVVLHTTNWTVTKQSNIQYRKTDVGITQVR